VDGRSPASDTPPAPAHHDQGTHQALIIDVDRE
jgi:hypothetical protein